MELEHVFRVLNDVIGEQDRELSYYRNCVEASHKREIEEKDKIIKKQLDDIRERDERIVELEAQLLAYKENTN